MTDRYTNQYVYYKPNSCSIAGFSIEDPETGERYTQFSKTPHDEMIETGHAFILFDDALELIEEQNTLHFVGKTYHEITEKEYRKALEVLPPKDWRTVDGVEIFKMVEYTTSNITAHYMSYNGRYFYRSLRDTTPYTQIAEEIRNLID